MAHPNSAPRADEDLEPLLSGYHCIFPRNFDEMMDHHGRVREHWRPFLGMLAALGPEEVNRRFAAADRHLRDSGVFYRVYEDPAGAVRPWPLSHVPLLIDAAEWQELEDWTGPACRAAGSDPRRHLWPRQPGARGAPAGCRRRRQSGISAAARRYRPAGRRASAVLWCRVGRSPDGRWWVLGDRTQAPSGAGYALENRLALSRAMPDLYREMRVERVAPFFQALRAELSALSRRDDSPRLRC